MKGILVFIVSDVILIIIIVIIIIVAVVATLRKFCLQSRSRI